MGVVPARSCGAVGRGSRRRVSKVSIVRIALMVICAAASGRIAAAQETINFASVSGRVTDPQGAVVQGAQITTRQTETNLTADTVTDAEGRFRFPYLKVGPYEITVRFQGFANATRSLTLTIGSAFELPVTLAVAGVDTSVTVTGEATVLEAPDPGNCAR